MCRRGRAGSDRQRCSSWFAHSVSARPMARPRSSPPRVFGLVVETSRGQRPFAFRFSSDGCKSELVAARDECCRAGDHDRFAPTRRRGIRCSMRWPIWHWFRRACRPATSRAAPIRVCAGNCCANSRRPWHLAACGRDLGRWQHGAAGTRLLRLVAPPAQWAIRTGSVIRSSMWRVVPPSTTSRSRE